MERERVERRVSRNKHEETISEEAISWMEKNKIINGLRWVMLTLRLFMI